MLGHNVAKPKRLGEGADADGLEIGAGKYLRRADQAAPLSEDTGTNMPENCTAGRIVMMAAAKMAAVWDAAKTEIRRPNPVLART